MTSRLLPACVAALLLSAAGGVQAAPLTWTLNNVTFADGGTAVGSFVYDATTNVYSSVAITTTFGSSFGGASYSVPLLPNPPAAPTFVPLALSAGGSADLSIGSTTFSMFFASPLTDAGGVRTFGPIPGGERQCTGDPAPGFICPSAPSSVLVRNITGGFVSAPAVVPVPAAAWLFAGGLGALGALRRGRGVATPA